MSASALAPMTFATDNVQTLADGLVQLDDPSVRVTARDGPLPSRDPSVHRDRVTLLHARENCAQQSLPSPWCVRPQALH